MSQANTTAQAAIERFEANEKRVDTWVNKPGEYETNTTPPQKVITLPSLVDEVRYRYQTPLMRGDWAPETQYGQNDVVKSNGLYYLATEPHISSDSFDDDLAAKKWLLYSSGIEPASQTSRGIVRMATDAEVKAGVTGDNGPAVVSPEQMREYGSGVPLLTPIWSALGLVEYGYLDISQDNGLLFRSAYPEAFAKIQQAYDASTGAVTDDTSWLAERDANNGVCGKFSLGDGSTTFRVPLLRKRASFGFPDPTTGAKHGDFLPDAIGPLEMLSTTGSTPGGVVGLGSTAAIYGVFGGDGGSKGGTDVWVQTLGGSPSKTLLRGVKNDDITHGPLVIYTPLLKMYGAVTEASTANIAELIQQTNTRVPTADYEADKAAQAPFDIVGFGIVAADGSLSDNQEITTSSRTATGKYLVVAPSLVAGAKVWAFARTAGMLAAENPDVGLGGGQVGIQCSAASSGAVNSSFYIFILRGNS